MPQVITQPRERREVNPPEKPRELADHFKEYAQENPTTCAMWCFVVGFVLGWRLKPW
jgi:hypothetical protein